MLESLFVFVASTFYNSYQKVLLTFSAGKTYFCMKFFTFWSTSLPLLDCWNNSPTFSFNSPTGWMPVVRDILEQNNKIFLHGYDKMQYTWPEIGEHQKFPSNWWLPSLNILYVDQNINMNSYWKTFQWSYPHLGLACIVIHILNCYVCIGAERGEAALVSPRSAAVARKIINNNNNNKK